MKQLLLLLSTVLLHPALTSSQELLSFEQSCGYNDNLSDAQVWGFVSDKAAQTAMNRIMTYTGLPANFEIKAADVPNAAAVINGDKRLILYNQYFMLRIRDETNTDWSAISILAHEIGHHLSGHTLGSIGSRPDKELEADRFSGFVLFRMGATLEQARAAMEKIADPVGNKTHPPRSARLAAITNGWVSAREQASSPDPAPNPDPKPIEKQPEPKPIETKPVETKPVEPQPAPKPSPPAPTSNTLTNQEIAGRAKIVFDKIWVDHDVIENDLKGMRIHFRFSIQNMQGWKCRAGAFFYFDSGKRLKDFDGKYCTTTGDVATNTDYFKPRYDNSSYEDYVLFMPNRELHMDKGSYDLKFRIGLFYEDVQMYVSDFYKFNYTKGE